MVYQLPSSFSGGMQGAVESLKAGTLPKPITSPVVKPAQVKEAKLPVKKKTTGYVPLTPEQFNSAISAGFSPEQIIEMEKMRKEQAQAQKTLPTNRREAFEASGYNEKIAEREKQQKDIFGGLIGSVPKQIGNVGKFVSNVGNVLLPGQPFKEWGTEFQQSGEEVGNMIQRKIGARPESGYTKGGEFAGEVIGGTLLGGGAIKVASMLPRVVNIAEKAPFVSKVIRGATEGLGFDVASQGEVGLGTVLGGVFPVAGAGFNKVKNLITRSLPESLISKGLATPSALLNASERLSRLSDEGVVNIDKAPQWLLNKGIAGNKKQIQTQLTDIIKNSAKQKSSLLANAKINNAPQVLELQQGIGEVLKNFAKVTKKGEIIPTAGNKEIVEELVGFINNKNPSAVEFERARALLGNMGIFTKGGALADSAQKEGLQRVWINASKYLDEAIPGFRSVNKDIEVANALQKAIGLKEAQDSVRQLLNMTNLWTGGLGASVGYAQTRDVKGAILGGLGGLGGRYILNNPAVLTRLAQGLSGNKLKTVLNALQKTGVAKKVIIPAITKMNQ